MFNPQSQPNIFHIPPGIAFLPALVKSIKTNAIFDHISLSGDPLELTEWTILLPTRRAARSLIEAFLAADETSNQLLPSIRTLGDSDEEAALFTSESGFEDNFELPPAISGLSRQFILAGMIRQWVSDNPDTMLAETIRSASAQIFDLARSLAQLADRLDTHEAVLADLVELFEGDFAGHQQAARDFLKIISEQLPKELEKRGMIGPMERRSRLMQNYARQLMQHGSKGPVIAAGSTGSIPATAQLLSVIAHLDNGAVILPGLDTDMDDASWQSMKEHHPQFGMRELLSGMKADREQVQPLPKIDGEVASTDRIWLAGEIMRPADTTQQWRSALAENPGRIARAMNGVSVIKAGEQSEEAAIIALIMRKAINDRQKAALITPDRRLAQKVKAAMARWQIEVDDSAGEPLSNSTQGIFIRLVLDTAASKFKPAAIKAMLSHPYSDIGDYLALETAILRSGKSWQNLAEFRSIAENQQQCLADQKHLHPTVRRLGDADWKLTRQQASLLAEIFAPLEQCYATGGQYRLQQLVECHLEACKKLDQKSQIWRGEAGEQLLMLMQSLLDESDDCPDLTINDYASLLLSMLAQTPVRPRFSEHPDLAIYGLMEARLIASDIIIMGGLNENVWPMAARTDPWLNRPQSVNIGIPVPERRIGLSAHDFVQGFCNKKSFLTSSGKIDGSPAVASRWLTRLQALLSASEVEARTEFPWIEWAQGLDRSDQVIPVERPAPIPPVQSRPTRFSVTAIDKLVQNPYEFFANKILKLKPLNELTRSQGPAERGLMVHKALEQFCKTWPKDLPADAKDRVKSELDKALLEFFDDRALAGFYAAQLAAMADWFIENEQKLRKGLKNIHTEADGMAEFVAGGKNCQLTARADRIDELENANIRIIDYKTGSAPSFDETKDSFSAQLLLEGWIAANGGFAGIKAQTPSELTYIKLSGNAVPGETKLHNSQRSDQAITSAAEGMAMLVSHYLAHDSSYTANTGPKDARNEREFDYLSRWREWAYFHLQRDGND